MECTCGAMASSCASSTFLGMLLPCVAPILLLHSSPAVRNETDVPSPSMGRHVRIKMSSDFRVLRRILGIRLILGRLGMAELQVDARTILPQPFETIVVAGLLMHDVDDEVTVVK